MTYYIVKHGSSDYRLHREDGTEVATWSSDPRDGNKVSIHQEILEDFGLGSSTAQSIAEWYVNGFVFRRSGDTPW